MKQLFEVMNEILKTPERTLAAARDRSTRRPVMLIVGALACYLAYAGAAGLFQGGSGVALAALKIPLIVLASVALCIPSFYVFTALAGADYSVRELGTVVAGFCAVAGLILVGVLPILWLFTVSSRSLLFIVWLHIFLWLTALVFAREYLLRAVAAAGRAARAAVGFWLIIVFIVSLQMTTTLRPVLWRAPHQPLFAASRMSFFTHLGQVSDWQEPKAQTAKK